MRPTGPCIWAVDAQPPLRRRRRARSAERSRQPHPAVRCEKWCGPRALCPPEQLRTFSCRVFRVPLLSRATRSNKLLHTHTRTRTRDNLSRSSVPPTHYFIFLLCTPQQPYVHTQTRFWSEVRPQLCVQWSMLGGVEPHTHTHAQTQLNTSGR